MEYWTQSKRKNARELQHAIRDTAQRLDVGLPLLDVSESESSVNETGRHDLIDGFIRYIDAEAQRAAIDARVAPPALHEFKMQVTKCAENSHNESLAIATLMHTLLNDLHSTLWHARVALVNAKRERDAGHFESALEQLETATAGMIRATGFARAEDHKKRADQGHAKNRHKKLQAFELWQSRNWRVQADAEREIAKQCNVTQAVAGRWIREFKRAPDAYRAEQSKYPALQRP